MRQFTVLLLLAALPALAASSAALAGGSTTETKASETKAPETKAADIAMYRGVEMGSVGKHMKLASMIYKGTVNRPNDLVAHATAMHDASLVFGELFPAGSGPDKVKTEAKAEVWTDAAGFATALKGWQDASAAWLDATKKGDVTTSKAAFDKVGQSCGACHDTYRVKD